MTHRWPSDLTQGQGPCYSQVTSPAEWIQMAEWPYTRARAKLHPVHIPGRMIHRWLSGLTEGQEPSYSNKQGRMSCHSVIYAASYLWIILTYIRSLIISKLSRSFGQIYAFKSGLPLFKCIHFQWCVRISP